MSMTIRFFMASLIFSGCSSICSMSTQMAKGTAAVLGTAGACSLAYGIHANAKKKYSFEKSNTPHAASLGLFASSLLVYRRSPLGMINRASKLLRQKNLLTFQVSKIVTNDNSTADKLTGLASCYAVSKVPLAAASKDLNDRLKALLDAEQLLDDARKKTCTEQEGKESAQLRKEIQLEQEPLQNFVVALKQTPEYSAAMTVQAQIDQASAAESNATANSINAGANIANAFRPRY